MPRISNWFDGVTPFVVCAAVLVVFGIFAFLLELQSASVVQWDGIKVHGDTYAGVTTYTYKGQQYSVDNRGVSATDLRHIPTVVWLSRSDPTDSNKAFIESAWDRWADFVFVLGWFFGAFLFLAVGFTRKLVRGRRRDAMVAERFGTGLDPELVARLLAERRGHAQPVDIDDP